MNEDRKKTCILQLLSSKYRMSNANRGTRCTDAKEFIDFKIASQFTIQISFCNMGTSY